MRGRKMIDTEMKAMQIKLS